MDAIIHFLNTEINHCRERKIQFKTPFFNGVRVGYSKSEILHDTHIDFCKYLINLIEHEQECEKCIKENTKKVNR